MIELKEKEKIYKNFQNKIIERKKKDSHNNYKSNGINFNEKNS